ncbi:hypothetical protein PM082_000080 [Marasmius tenuissimus]|nr:hypothetical protein PM082_000080 [Marasmius tenuissimus]
MITLYDLGPYTPAEVNSLVPHPSSVPWFILRYKNLPYEIKPINVLELQTIAPSLGAPPTITHPMPKYTIPFMKDSETGKILSNSLTIAEYLDQTYPDTPKVVPENSKMLLKIFQSDILARTAATNNDVVRPYLFKQFPKEFQEMVPLSVPTPEVLKDALSRTREQFEQLNLNLDGGVPYRGFLMGGDRPTIGDFTVLGFVYPLRLIYGEGSEEWKEVKSWANGWVGWLVEEILKAANLGL